MTSLVLDTSTTMAWCFEDEACEAADAALDLLVDGDAVVPGLWVYEVANVLLVAERQGRITDAQALRFLDLLAQLPIAADASPAEMAMLVSTGRRYSVSAYDAAYLVLAGRSGLPLATLDEPLRRACRDAGVNLLVA